MNIYITILLEFLLISSSILLLFKYRKTLGLAPLYLFLGAVQYSQAFSGAEISFVVLEGITIYPGSVIVFSAVLFAVLLIYIKEGVYSTRALILGIVISNFLLTAMFGITHQQELAIQIFNEIESSSIFIINYKFFITGTILLMVDFFLLVIIYQYLVLKITKQYLLLTLFISLLLVLIFDSIVFNIVLNFGSVDFNTSIVGHIIGKSISALLFSFILYIYLKYIDTEKSSISFVANQNKDIFSIIKYGKKYLDINVEKKLVSQLETTLNHISDGFVSLDTNWCYTYVNIKAGEFLGRSPESLIGKHIWTEFPDGVGLPFYDIYYKAVKTQKTQYFQEYYEPFDKWFENRIYPSSEGLTIYFTDITENKKVDANNQMLRSLIETSDDFIGLADLEGKPLYLNTNGRALIDLENDEKLPPLISDFFPDHFLDAIENNHLPNIFVNNKWKGEAHFVNFKTKALIPIEMSSFLITDSKNDNPIALGIVATNITKRKEAEEKLIKSEQLFRGLSTNAPVAIYKTDKDGICNFVNEEWIKLSGLTYNDSMGYGWSNAIHPEDRDRIISEWEKDILTKTTIVSEYRIVHKNDKITWHASKTVGLFNTNKELYGYMGMLIDISERKEAEEQFIANEKYLDNIINNIGDPVFVKDDKHRMILVNDAVCTLFNLSREDIIGKTLAENVPPEERESFLSIDKQVLLTGIENENEETFTINENETRFISTKKTRFIDKNGNKFLIGVIRDITDQKMAEKEILALGNRNTQVIGTLLDGFILADTTGKILDVNPSYINMIGYTREELLTMNINQLEAALNQTEIEERIKEMMSEGFVRFNSNHKKKNGELIDLDVNTFTMQLNEQNVVAAFVKDITEQKKAEIALKENEEKFSKAFESRVIGKAILNNEKRIIEVNNALANIVGFKRENMLGKTAEEIGLFNFDSTENLENEEKLWSEFSKNGFVHNIELKYLIQNGRELFILISLQSLQLNNEDHILITILDITEKKNDAAELAKHRNKLEELVELRTEEVNLKNNELQRMNKLFVGRELRMKELKNIIKELQNKNE